MPSESTHLQTTGLKPGDKLDKYDVLEQIGAGGMSVVWKGYDGLLDQYVAIKQVMPEPGAGAAGDDAAEEEFRERFRQEAAIHKRVAASHKHLVRVIDVIEERRGLFLVMEYVDGKSLEQLLEQTDGPIDERQALGIIAACAVALDEIHGKDVVHRDLKPSNILLPKDGGMKICDFGLAEVMSDQNSPSSGSVRYMAPELFRGEKVDGRADIYALGMIAYEMLAGRPAFKEAFKVVLRDQRNQALRWMKWHTNERVTAPPLTQLSADIPPTLSELVARMMEKDPDKRISDAQELLAAIKRHFTGKSAGKSGGAKGAPGSAPGSARGPIAPAGKTAVLPTQRKRRPLAVALIASTVVLLVLLGGLMGYSVIRDAREKSRAQAAEIAEAEKAYGEAKKLYDEQRYAAAKPKWEALAEEWPNHPKYGAISKAVSLFCAAVLHHQAGRYQDAIDAMDAAAKVDIPDTGARNSIHDRIDALRDDNQHRQSFAIEFDKVQRVLAGGEFAQARSLLHRLHQLTLFDDEEKQLAEFGAAIEYQDRQAAILAILDAAEKEETSGRRTQAIAILKDATQKFSDSRLTDLLDKLQGDALHDQTLAAARQYEQSGDLANAVKSYEAVNRLRPDPAHQQKINSFRSRLAYTAGKAHEDAGRVTQAVDEYNKALAFAENADARAALARIDNLGEQQSYIRSGDGAAAAGNLDTAIQHYTKAIELGAGAEVRAKLTAVTVQSKIAEAKKQLFAGKFDETLALLTDVETHDPGNAEAQQIRQNVETWKTYLAYRNKGDELRQRGELGRAMTEFRKARGVIGTEEITKRLNDTEYDSLVAQARRDIEAKNWDAASGLLAAALRTKNTTEAQQLRDEVERQRKGQRKDG